MRHELHRLEQKGCEGEGGELGGHEAFGTVSGLSVSNA